MRMQNGCGEELESMHVEPAQDLHSGGTGPLTCGPMGTGSEQDWGPKESPSCGPKEPEVSTLASTQIPYRCTNSYAYL